MTTLIREAFINNLNSADWMDTETKEAARQKVRMSFIDYQDKEVKSVQKGSSLNFTGFRSKSMLVQYTSFAQYYLCNIPFLISIKSFVLACLYHLSSFVLTDVDNEKNRRLHVCPHNSQYCKFEYSMTG